MGNDLIPGQDKPPESEGWPVFDLWQKYEEIAMHFNDLLIKLRTQALGAVAAISTLVGIFGRTGADNKESWEIAAAVFFFLCLFWIAIWIIDFCYYNRLLLGAVKAILEVEKLSQSRSRLLHINISTCIEEAVAGGSAAADSIRHSRFRNLILGRWAFYIIVFLALVLALSFSIYEYKTDLAAPAVAPPAF